MIFRNSIKSIFRSKGKTALFLLLIFTLTLALALGVSVWASVDQFLNDCDEYFTTIGLLEYMGTGYPDDTAYDSAMSEALASFDEGLITNDSSTLAWEVPQRSFGYVDGFWRTDAYVPEFDYSVLVIGKVFYDERHASYSATVFDAVYSARSKDDSIIYIDSDFADFEEDEYYLVFGEIYHSGRALLHLRGVSFENAISDANNVQVPRTEIITSHEEGIAYSIPDDSVIMQVAETLKVRNNSILISATNDVMSLFPFHQEELYIVDGRAFTDEEYVNGSHVAIIPELMASRLGIGVGDKLDFSVAESEYPGIYNSYWAPDGFTYNGSFTVVGLFNTVLAKSWYVYVPREAGVPESQFHVGYTIGQAVIDNDSAAEFYSKMETLLEERFQLTIYDQGYSSVAIPYQSILSVAKIVTGVCVLVEVAVLILFGFLFVYRQRETSETMLMLGSGKNRVVGYFLFSSGFIALFASIAGAIAGYYLHDRIINIVVGAAKYFTLIDSRYSNGNLTITKTLEFAPKLQWDLFIVVGAAVFAFAVLACIAFTIGTFINNRPSQKRSFGPKREHKTSRMGAGSLKYALLSIFRGSSRTLVVPLLAITVTLFFGQLATTSLRYEEQLEAIYANTSIDGYFTDIHGKQIGNQVLNGYDINNLYHSGKISSVSITYGKAYYFLGISKTADGVDQQLAPFYVPTNPFSHESVVALIQRGPEFTGTNDIYSTPEFYYADSISMNYLSGFDATFLTEPFREDQTYSCILPSSFMEEEGISLGDTIQIVTDEEIRNEDNERIFKPYDLFVVGSYEKQGDEETIYAPISVFFDTGLIWDEGRATTGAPTSSFDTDYSVTDELNEELLSMVIHSATFTLTNSNNLVSTKDYLSNYGYSQVNDVGSVRKFIVLKDASFNNAVSSVKQQILYIDTLYPVLYALVGIIAIAVSYLLVVSRKQEFATMRGLGAKRIRSFLSFFLEQSILCTAGALIGLVIWSLIWGLPIAMHLILVAGFLVCYFLGCAISIMILNYSNVLSILLDRD